MISFPDSEDPGLISVSAAKGSGSFTVKTEANFDYGTTIICDNGNWLSLVKSSRTEISLKYDANTDFIERKATVNLCQDNTILAVIDVEQDAGDVVLKYAAPDNREFRRVVSFPYYRDLTAAGIPDEYLKTCNVAVFAFAYLNKDYSVYVEKPAMLVQLVSRCRSLGVEKVLLAFSGTKSLYAEMVRKGSRRVKFVNDMMKFVDLYKLDGIDNDWEYPSANDDSKNNNLMLMRLFSNALHSPERNMILSMDITDGRWSGGYREGIDPGVYDCCDFFNNMSYNSIVASEKPEGYDACKIMETSYNWWVGTRKMPKSKFVLGMPLYGTDPYLDVNWGYRTIIRNGGDPQKDIAKINSDGKAYTFFYNGIPTVRKKVQTMKDRGCGGYMFWEGSFDSFDEQSLLMAAYKTAVN